MSGADLEEEVALLPAAGPMLELAGVAWLAPLRTRLASMQLQQRLPHGFLLAGPPGAGQAELGAWLAARLLCRRPAADACGKCADCRLVLAGNHPDLRWVGVLAEKKEISIDQMRELSAALALHSYRGGAKVAVIAPAEAMNAKAFNALLKTLEEPGDDTYLVLAASRVDRLPKTVASRCMRLRLPLPGTQEAIAWLRGRTAREDWLALLELAGGAPFLALEYAERRLGGLDAEMQAAIASAVAGRLDIVAFAEASARNSPAARLVWLESWLTRSLKQAAVASDPIDNNRLPWLRPPGAASRIRAGYGLLDELREARRLVGGALNTQLLFEGLSVSLAALVGRSARQSGEQ
jgi:DNA polymerase III subunit delta'